MDTFQPSPLQLSSTTDLKLKHINNQSISLKPLTTSLPLLKALMNSIMNSNIFTVLSKETTAAPTFLLITNKLLTYFFIKLVIRTWRLERLGQIQQVYCGFGTFWRLEKESWGRSWKLDPSNLHQYGRIKSQEKNLLKNGTFRINFRTDKNILFDTNDRSIL